MKLEGIDPKHPSLYCVLSVAEVRGYRLRLHFDGYSECHDFWANADSAFIFPVGWSEKNGKRLQVPKSFTTETFNWATYAKMSKTLAAPKHLFFNTSAAVSHFLFSCVHLQAPIDCLRILNKDRAKHNVLTNIYLNHMFEPFVCQMI